MKTVFAVFLVVWVTALIGKAQMDEPSCPNSINCTGGLQNEQIPVQTQICALLVSLLLASRSACYGPFGNPFTITDTGFDTHAVLTGNDNVCDYFQPNTTVDDCLHPNGTIEANYCNPLFLLGYQLRNNCSDLYSFNGCELSPYAQTILEVLYSTVNTSCLLTPYMSDCSLEPSSQPPEKCPNCKIQPCANS